MIEDYVRKSSLSKLGYRFNPDNLSDFEVSCFSLISNQFKDLEMKELERQKK